MSIYDDMRIQRENDRAERNVMVLLCILALFVACVLVAVVYYGLRGQPQSLTIAASQDASIIATTERRVVPQPQVIITPSPSPTSVKPDTMTLIVRAANLCGVPPAIAIRLVMRESSMRQYDKRGRVLRSSSGALGLTQIKPASARDVSRTLNVREPWDNLLAGFCLLQKYRKKDDWRTALHRYRLGPSAKVTQAARDYASDILEATE